MKLRQKQATSLSSLAAEFLAAYRQFFNSPQAVEFLEAHPGITGAALEGRLGVNAVAFLMRYPATARRLEASLKNEAN
jgi:hypothetical protein